MRVIMPVSAPQWSAAHTHTHTHTQVHGLESFRMQGRRKLGRIKHAAWVDKRMYLQNFVPEQSPEVPWLVCGDVAFLRGE